MSAQNEIRVERIGLATLYLADCMEVLSALPDDSIHASIYSPPFAGLYHYSSDERDLSNARDVDEFFEHYGYVIDQKLRVTIPGRTSAVHAAPIPTGNTGKDGLYDFPGRVIEEHRKRGWVWVSRHAIWKEPLAVRNRTMQKNLAHKTIVEDGAMGGVASADELLIFRKPGAGEPVRHPNGLTGRYAGAEQMPTELHRYQGWEGDQKSNRYSHWIWRRYASSVWDDIRLQRVLPFRDAKDEDERDQSVADVVQLPFHLRQMPCQHENNADLQEFGRLHRREADIDPARCAIQSLSKRREYETGRGNRDGVEYRRKALDVRGCGIAQIEKHQYARHKTKKKLGEREPARRCIDARKES